MKNLWRDVYNKITVALTGQEDIETDGTDLSIASGDSTLDSGNSTTLASITVPPGAYAVLGDAFYFTNSTTGGKLTVSFVNPVTTLEEKRYLAVAAAGSVQSVNDFSKHPFMAVFNPASSESNLTITISTTSTTTSSEYIASVAYVLRMPKE